MTDKPIHIYIIHLDRRTNRYNQFQTAWKSVALNKNTKLRLHWHSAVEGIKLHPSAFTGFHTVARTRKSRAGRLGAYLSHTGAIAAAIAANHFPLLILEDDAAPTTTLTSADALHRAFANAPATANLLYLGGLPTVGRKADKAFCRRRMTAKNKTTSHWSYLHSAKTTPSTPSYLFGGHAYGFPTATAAQEVLSDLQKTRITFDSALVRYQKKHPDKVAVHCPFLFRQAEGFSNINSVFRPGGLGVID